METASSVVCYERVLGERVGRGMKGREDRGIEEKRTQVEHRAAIQHFFFYNWFNDVLMSD